MTDLRRRLLVTALSLASIPRFPGSALLVADSLSVGLLTGWVDGDGTSHLVYLEGLEPVRKWTLGFEPHQILTLSRCEDGGSKEVLAIGRKPGEYALRQRLQENGYMNVIEPPPGMYLFGHGAIDPRRHGILLTGQDMATECGLILGYDLHDLSYRGAHPTGGIEPHQVLQDRKGRWWAAHGGRRLQPEYWRRQEPAARGSDISIACNAFAFQPMISLPFDGISLRHLVQLSDGRMVVGARAPERTSAGVLLVVDCDDECCNVRSLPLAGSVQYALSIHADGDWLGAAFPMDDCIMLWNISKEFQVQRMDFPEPTGLCLHKGSCIVTTRTGTVIRLARRNERWKAVDKMEFGGRFTDHLQMI